MPLGEISFNSQIKFKTNGHADNFISLCGLLSPIRYHTSSPEYQIRSYILINELYILEF